MEQSRDWPGSNITSLEWEHEGTMVVINCIPATQQFAISWQNAILSEFSSLYTH